MFAGECSCDIYRGLFYIIKEFLNGQSNQLFIQFPTDKIGRTDEVQKANRNHIQEFLADFLCLAAKNGWEGKLKCPNIDQTKIGEFYYSEGLIWEIKSSNFCPVRPSTSDRRYNNLSTPLAIKMYEKTRSKGVKLLNVINSDAVPLRKIKDWVERINLYRELPSFYTASKCILVGRNQYWKNQPINTGCIDNPIIFVSDYGDVRNLECDVLVILWDKKYLDYERDINNAVAEGRIRKVVFIGTEIFDGFKKCDTNLVYPFTYRELYTYFDSCDSAKSQFPQFEFRKVAFPSLIDKVSEIERIIPEHIEESDRRRIIRFSLYPFLSMRYSLPQVDRLRSYLWENFESLAPSEIDSIIDWISSVSFSGRSPKESEDQRIVSDKQKFYINPIESYKDRLNAYLKNTNSNRQVYIIDAFINDKRYIDIIKSLLERGCRGTFYLLSYFDIPYLKRFFEDEVSIYTSEERRKFLDIEFDLNISSEAPISNNLIDYYDASTDDLSLIFTPQQPVKHLTYTCSFDECRDSFIVDGDVIYYSGTKTIDELYNNKEDHLPCRITFYKTPSNFQHLMEVYFNFPKGKNVEYFSRLWKQKMQELLKVRYNSDVSIMAEDFRFLKLEKLKSIVRDKYQSLFPDEIGQVAIALNRMGSISLDEMRLIRSANAVVGKHSAKAKELKSSLIQYELTGNIDGFLSILITNGNARGEKWSAESLSKQIMLTYTLVDIKLNK